MNLTQNTSRSIATALDLANHDATDDDVQIALIGFIPQLLEDLKCDAQAIFQEIDIDCRRFDDANATILVTKAYRLLAACAKATDTPHFGLLMGERFAMPLLGVVEQMMRHSNTVHAALLQLIQYFHVNDRGAVVYLLELKHDEVALGYSVFSHQLVGLPQLYDYSMLNAFKIMRQLCGSAWRPKRVTFAYRTPQNLTPYQNQFHAPVYFDTTRTEIIFSKHWLHGSLQSANQTQRILSERVAREIECDSEKLFMRTVRHTIQTLLLKGDASAKLVCKQLRVHERVLRRRLQVQGTSIKRLKQVIRLNLACQLLGITKLTLSEIASVLGYSDSTAFSRAFHQQSGLAPATWRNQNNSESN